jgi:hypothetical protein
LEDSIDNDVFTSVSPVETEQEPEKVKTKAELEAERTAKLEAERAAVLLAERIAKLEIACFTETVAPIVTGAARGGRFAVCSSTLAKMPKTTGSVFHLLQAHLVRALSDCAAKCRDVASFSYVLRALLMVSHAGMSLDLDSSTGLAHRSGTDSARRWTAAAVCNEHCDTALSLQQFAKLVHIEYFRNKELGPITDQSDTAAAAAAVTMAHAMWAFYDIKGALTWALARCGIPILHARFIRECAAEPIIIQDLVHKVAQKGSVQVLAHLLQEGLVASDELISLMNCGAVEGDKVQIIQWLQSQGLLIDSIRSRVMPCHNKLIAYFTELDRAALVI